MKNIKNRLSALLVFIYIFTNILSPLSTLAAGQDSKKEAPKDKTELLVKFKDDSKAESSRSRVKSKLQIGKLDSKARGKKSRIQLLEINEGDDVNAVIKELKKDSNVLFAQPNYKLSAAAAKSAPAPLDELFSQQWGLFNNGQKVESSTGTAGQDISALAAWGLTKGSPVLVGVLDTGIDTNHEDLKDNIYVNTNEIKDNGIDDDGNGYIDDISGWDFANGDNSVFDDASLDMHGTQVAGVIAAGENGTGIVGGAPKSALLPLKFINGTTGYTSDAIEAIEYASRMGVKIVNCSFSGSSSNPALKEAMAESGLLFVCAAGNEGRDLSKSPVYPAGFELSNILTVGAQNNKGQLAALSNYGINVDVAAPGIDILTTQPQNKYGYISGTSFAAPYASAAAALLLSLLPDMTAAQLATRIKSTAAKSNETTGKVAYGRVDANAALTDNQGSSTDIVKKPAADTRLPEDESVVAVCAATIAPELLEQIHYGETGVNAATGNYSKTDIDMSVVAPGFTVNMSRTYNSKDDRATSTMGRGWTFGFEGSLKKDANYASNSVLIAKLPNGSAQVFIDNRNGTYTANDSRSTLVKNQDGTTTLTTKDQYTYIFNTTTANPEGYLTEMRDRNKNSLKISLDTAVPGKVLSVTDTVGRQFGITYDTNNLITKISDIKGKRYVKYEYSASKLLTTVSAIALEGDTPPAIYTYEYDASNYLTKIKDALKNTLEQITYDHASGTNQHKVTKSTDQNGNTFTYTYDPTNRTTTIKDSSTPAAITLTKKYDTAYYITESIDPEGKTTTVEYYLDTNNYNKYGEEKKIKDRNGNLTEYARDERGNITKIVNPDKSTREYTYDAWNNTKTEKDETGRATYYTYDDTGRLQKKIQPLNGTDEYDINADQSKYSVTKYIYYTDEESQALGYKAKGLLRQTVDPAGGVTKYEYDADGNQTSITDPEGNTTKNQYNPLGWLTKKISPSGNTVTYTYDAYGRVVKTVLDKGETTRTVYDLLGRKIQDISPNQYEEEKDGLNLAVPTQTYADAATGTRYEYNTAGRVKKVTDPLDNSVEYTYDIYGNTLTEKLTDSTGKEKNTKSYTYDTMNRLTTVSFKGGSDQTTIKLESYAYAIQTDGKTQKTHTRYLNTNAPAITGTTTSEAAITQYTYDYANRQVEQKNPDGGRLTTEYNPNGTIASTTDAMGNTTRYKYDGRNNLSEKWTPMEEGLYSYTKISYDKAGRKAAEQTGKDKTELYTIPSADRLITQSYAYDKNGSIKTVTDSSGRRTENQYDSEGNLAREDIFTAKDTFNTTKYTYNHMGKITSRTKYIKKADLIGNQEENKEEDQGQESLTTTYAYDKNGNLIEEKTPDGVITSYTYDLLGRQTETRKLETDEHGLPAIAVTKTAYDSQGNITSTTDAKGITTTYCYDDRGLMQQSKKTTTQTTSAGSITIDHITACYYDLAGRKTAEVSPENYIPGAACTQMNRTEYVYDKMGRLKAKIQEYKAKDEENFTTLVTAAYKYDKNGNLIKELDGEGYRYGVGTTLEEKISSGYGTEKTYNQAGLLETELDPAAKTNGLKNTKKNTYDGAGRKTSETDARGVITCYTYDDAGNIKSTAVRKTQSDPELVTGTQQYDLAGNLTEKTDGNGNTTKYQYNSLNKLRKTQYPWDETIPAYTETYQYDKKGNLRKKEDSLGTQTLYTYDNEGRILSQTQQDSKGRDKISTFAAYDLNGNKTKETDGNGTEKENKYDEKNRLIEQKTNITGINNKTITHTTQNKYDKNDNLLEQASYIDGVLTGKTSAKYDPLNRAIEKSDAYNTIQTLEYDKSHRQTKAKDANGNETKYIYDRSSRLIATTDPEGNTTRQSYDSAGNLTEKTDGNGNKTTYSYDQLGRLQQVTNAKGEKTGYTYDACGNLLTQTDGRGNVTSYEYNAANKQIRKIYPGGKKTIEGKTVYDPAKTETYTYNADGTPATKKDRNGQTTSYKNDIHGRVITKTIDKKEIAYTYDANGNQLTITDETGKTARIYDGLNRVISKSVPHLGASTYEYDIPVNSQTVPEMTASYTLPEGSTAEKTTDAKGNETTKIYDGAGRLAYVIAEGKVTGYTYDANGSRQSVKYPDGATEEKYEYDKNNRLKKLTNLKKDGTILEEYKYTYDGAGNQTTKTETIQGKEKGTTAYRYDSLNRLLEITEPQQETGSRKTTGYTYDASGNRETEQVQAKTVTGTAITLTTYKNDEQNRLVAATEEKGDGTKKTTTYVYDNNGNLTRKSMEQTREIDPSNPPKAKFGMYIEGQKDGATKNAKPIVAGTASYEYDVWNQLVKATTGEGTSTYSYNGEGYRTEKTENGKTTRSLYEGDKVILETDENGKETARNIYGTNLIARTVTTRESGTTKEETYSYMYNGHGDVTALLGADGTVAAGYYYDAFGNITEQTGSVNNNITYAGYQYDKETDLYYLNARMYDAKTARFLQEDTYLGNAGDPLSLNLYTYCANNPVIYIDPTGHVVAKVGTKGDTVAAIQEDLKKLGYNVKVDGIFGEQTKAAVIKFQKDNGLVVDGIVGNQTLTEINFEQNRQTANAKGIYLPEPEKAAVGQIKGDVSIMTDAKYQQAINNIVEVKSKTNGGSVNTGVVGNELAVQKVNIKSDIPTAAPVTVTPKVPVPAAASAQMSTLTNQVAQVSGYMALANLSSINANKSTTAVGGVSLDAAVKSSFNTAWSQNLANDNTPTMFKQLFPGEMYRIMQAPGKNQMLDTLAAMYGEDYRDAVVQRDLNENLQIANGLLLVATIGSDFLAAVQYNNNLQAEINAATANINKGTGRTGPKTDFYVTPQGEAVPATKQGFNYNLSKMTEQNGKYIGQSSNGSVRVRVEEAHPNKPAFIGQESVDHNIPHIHIEYRQNGVSGPWGKDKTTFPQDWLK